MRQLTMPSRFEDHIKVMCEPYSFDEALHSEDRQHRIKAMDGVIISLWHMGSCRQGDDKNVISNR